MGAAVGANASDLEGCFSLSNPITVNRVMPSGGMLTGGPFTFCVGDGVADNISANAISLTGNTGSNSQWVITDADGNILGLPPTFSAVNFDDAGDGVCLVWHLSYEDGLMGAAVGANASDLEGCFSLSNPITVNRVTGTACAGICEVDGGTISLASGGQSITQCAGAIRFSVRHNTSSDLDYYYVITDEHSTILEFLNSEGNGTLDLSAAPAGVCLIYGYSTNGAVLPIPGMNISSLRSQICGDISSNYIRLTRLSEAECMNNCHAPYNIRTSLLGNATNVRWSRVEEARGYQLRFYFPSTMREILVPVRSTHVRVSGFGGRTFELSIRTICEDGTFSDYSDPIIFNAHNAGLLVASNRSDELKIDELSDDLSFESFPNPFTDVLIIQARGMSGTVNVELYDVMGARQYQMIQYLHDDQLVIPTAHLTNGIYILQISNEQGGYTRQKMIKTSAY